MADGIKAPDADPVIKDTPDPDPKGPAPKDPPPGKTGTWEQALEDAKVKRDKWKGQAKAQEAELEQLRQERQQRLAKDAEAQDAAKLKDLEAQGKYQEALKSTEEKYKAQVEKVRQAAANKLIPMAIKSAAASLANLAPGTVDDLPALLAGRIGIDPDTLELFVRGDDGKPITDEKLGLVPVDKFIKGFVQERPYLLLDGMPRQHGQTPGRGGKSMDYAQALANPELMKAWEKDDPEGLKAAEKEYWSPKAVKARMGQKK